jgi:outer membrane receptor protein involved in Fe transport
MLGFGRVFKLKKGEQVGITAFVNQQRSQRIDGSTTQVMPDIASNVYPFADGSKPLIRSLADNTSYRQAAQLGATLNTAIVFGKNKISLKNFFSHQLTSTYTQRSQLLKPDEDSLAHAGISYLTEQTFLLNTQLSGEHGLGGDGKFKLSWQATYAYLRRQNPDERNFLLRQDPNDNSMFEIARPQSPAYSPTSTDPNVINSNFTNSGRQWLDNKEHNFTGSIDIQTPYDLWHDTQTLSGGVYIRTKYRMLNSDLYLTNGPGYFPLDQLLSPERYFPGGLTVQNYYASSPANLNFIYPNDRANYQASENLGAAYISSENRLPGNLSLNWGFRLETGSQLVSSIRYVYSDGFKYPQVSTLDENTKIQNTVLLPSATVVWRPLRPLNIHASYFKTVNRPELQELSAYRHYDALSFMVTTGNAVLATANIDNYDAGISYQPLAGTHIAVSGFHKRLDQPIGYILTAWSPGNLLSTPFNMPPATIDGLTGDVKVNLGYFSAFASGSWLRSKVSAGPVRNLGKAGEHSLNNTPDHTVNMGLVLQHPRLPMITVLYNRIGDYIIAAGSGAGYQLTNGSTVLSIPDYRMKERENLDLQVSQKMWHSRIQLIAGVNNLTNSATVIYQDLNANKQFDKPLTLAIKNNSGGYYQEGVDNTPLSIKAQRTYYFTLSYLFK